LSKLGTIPWNFNKTYDELKGTEWSNNFKKKDSDSKKGKKLKNRRFSTRRNKSYKYFRGLIKADLYESWIFPILERDKFSCRNCGENKNLEVHHIRPYRDILLLVSKKINLDLNKYNEFSDKEFDYFVKEIVKEHKLDDGITYCKNCHKKFDKYRDRFNRKETNNESQIYAISG
jgi:hypothetical protein